MIHVLHIERVRLEMIFFFLGGGAAEMEDFTGPKVPIEWLNFTAAQSAKVSNSGTQDDSPVWVQRIRLAMNFSGKW